MSRTMEVLLIVFGVISLLLLVVIPFNFWVTTWPLIGVAIPSLFLSFPSLSTTTPVSILFLLFLVTLSRSSGTSSLNTSGSPFGRSGAPGTVLSGRTHGYWFSWSFHPFGGIWMRSHLHINGFRIFHYFNRYFRFNLFRWKFGSFGFGLHFR